MSIEDNQALDQIMSVLDKAEQNAAEGQTDQHVAPETASEQAEQGETTEQEVEAVEQAQPAIEPPPTWKAELKARWKDVPADLQREFVQWETERNQGVNSKLNESAEAKKTADAERAAAAQERQRYATQLDTLIQQATQLDPVLAHASKMKPEDWTRLWQENPGQAGAFQQQVNERIATIQNWHSERQRLVTEQARTVLSQEESRLAEKIPEWRDNAKREEFKASVTKMLQADYGFRPEELSGTLDHRHVLVARDAMLYRQMMAAQKTAQEKRVAPVQRVVKPGPAQDGKTVESQRVKALKQRAIRTGKEADQVAAVLAAIGN